MIRLTLEQVLTLHRDLLFQSGGREGIRDAGLLDSALAVPFQGFGGVDFFPSIEEKAARLGYGLVRNHPMADGNKRLGAHAMLVFLALNGIELDYTRQELIDVILGLAAGVHDCAHPTRWIREHRREAGGTRVQDNQDL